MRKRLPDTDARTLLQQIADGNRLAFSRLYEALSPEIYAFIQRRTDNRETAEDIKQETFYVVWQSAGAFKGTSSVFSWVCGNAANKIPLAYRNRGPRADSVDDLEPGEEPVAEVDSPDTLLLKSQEKQGLNECMGKLSFEQRECLFLAFWHDCSEQETAEIQQIPKGTVKSRLSQARLKLKQCLARVLGNGLVGDTKD